MRKLTKASWAPWLLWQNRPLGNESALGFLLWLLADNYLLSIAVRAGWQESARDIRQLYNLVPASWLLKSSCWTCLCERKKKALWNWYVYPRLISKLTHQIHIQTTMLGCDNNYSDCRYHCVHTITQKNCTLRLLCWFRFESIHV